MLRPLLSALCLCWGLAAQAKDPPKVVSMTPANGATIPATTSELVVTFDRDMFRGGHSICGGGKSLPKVRGRPRWKGDRTLVIPVQLQPDQEYELSLNCSSARKIQAKDGVRLPPTRWTFTTFPKPLRPFAEQQQRNREALARLEVLLTNSYAYRDRVVADWPALLERHRGKLRDARTDRAFAVATSELLQATQDQHIVVGYRDSSYAPFTPLVEPLYRTFAVRRLFQLERVTPRAFRGRTDDGIAYLLITGWQEAVDVERLLGAIAEMMDAKALVIDVRPNVGGDERIARRVASWFVQGEKVYARHRSIGADGLGPVVDRKVRGNDVVYDRPVAVLAGPRVMSSCEAFVMMMKQAAGVQVVGQKTRGSSGNPVVHELGNAVSVQLPSWQALRPDGTCFEGEGIEPDVFVECTSRDFETYDPTLEKALALLRERIKNGK
ncbi:MAG: S41 family peptidase [Planctomycetota bacterium]